MKYLLLIFLLTGCATTSYRDERREKILDCTKDLIEYDAAATDAYQVCKDLYTVRK